MRRDLMSGTTLVIDRYAHSGVAFTAAKKVILPSNILTFSLVKFPHCY